MLGGAQQSTGLQYAQVFLRKLHHIDHMHVEHMQFVMCVSTGSINQNIM